MIVIGWVEFVRSGATLEAILDEDGRWSCKVAPHIAEYLNREYSPVGDPAAEDWGQEALIKAARGLVGIAWLRPGQPVD